MMCSVRSDHGLDLYGERCQIESIVARSIWQSRQSDHLDRCANQSRPVNLGIQVCSSV